jgi:hypothetical protein
MNVSPVGIRPSPGVSYWWWLQTTGVPLVFWATTEVAIAIAVGLTKPGTFTRVYYWRDSVWVEAE